MQIYSLMKFLPKGTPFMFVSKNIFILRICLLLPLFSYLQKEHQI